MSKLRYLFELSDFSFGAPDVSAIEELVNCTRALIEMNKWHSQHQDYDIESHADFFLIRGLLWYSSMDNSLMAIKDIRKAQKLFEEIELFDRADKMTISLEEIYLSMTMLGNTNIIEDYIDELVEDITKMQPINTERNQSILGEKLYRLSVMYDSIMCRPQSLEHYDRAISIYENLLESGKDYAQIHLGLNLMNRGNLHYESNDFHESLKDINKSIAFMEKGHLFHRNYLSSAYVYRGQIYNALNQNDLSEIEFNKAIVNKNTFY